MKKCKIKKSRSEKRNEYAELVCRELRYYLAKASIEMGDKSSLMEHLLNWMKFAKKNKYERP